MLSATLTYHLKRNNSDVSKDLLHNLYVNNVVSGCQMECEPLEYLKVSRWAVLDSIYAPRLPAVPKLEVQQKN